MRDLGLENRWGIKVNSIATLIELMNKYGELVIGTSYVDKETPMIEIYDGYRE